MIRQHEDLPGEPLVVPGCVFEHARVLRLTPATAIVASVLASYLRPGSTLVWPSLSTIERRAGVSHAARLEAMKRLVERGLVRDTGERRRPKHAGRDVGGSAIAVYDLSGLIQALAAAAKQASAEQEPEVAEEEVSTPSAAAPAEPTSVAPPENATALAEAPVDITERLARQFAAAEERLRAISIAAQERARRDEAERAAQLAQLDRVRLKGASADSTQGEVDPNAFFARFTATPPKVAVADESPLAVESRENAEAERHFRTAMAAQSVIESPAFGVGRYDIDVALDEVAAFAEVAT